MDEGGREKGRGLYEVREALVSNDMDGWGKVHINQRKDAGCFVSCWAFALAYFLWA